MTAQKVQDKPKHYTIVFDHNSMEFSIKIDRGYEDSKGTLKAVNEAIDFWKSCDYTYKE